ncbi:MAG: glycosyltransferase [Candidatus Beckwithbacteria bacterium]|nr:glycosyltransferase [Patescibacteria group bacterium]
MRILIVSTSYPPYMSGLAIATANLGLELSKNHQLTIVSSSHTKKAQTQILNPNLTLRLMPSFRFNNKTQLTLAYPQHKKIEILINQFKPDIIHLQDFSPICLTALNLGKQLHIPIVITHHFTAEYVVESLIPTKIISRRLSHSQITKKLIYKLTNPIYNQCNLVTVPNPNLIPYFKQAKLVSPIIAVPNGIVTKNFQVKTNLKSILKKYQIKEPKLIIFVGRLDLDKNLKLLLEAFAPISQHNPDTCLVYIGEGRQKDKLNKMAHKLKINHSVYFLGKIDNQQKALSHLYNAATIFANPSIIENQSVAFIEALAAGLPIVASNLPNLSSFIKSNLNGLLFEANNPIALATCLQILLSNQKLRKRISNNNLKLAKQYDISHTSQLYLKAYQSLI